MRKYMCVLTLCINEYSCTYPMTVPSVSNALKVWCVCVQVLVRIVCRFVKTIHKLFRRKNTCIHAHKQCGTCMYMHVWVQCMYVFVCAWLQTLTTVLHLCSACVILCMGAHTNKHACTHTYGHTAVKHTLMYTYTLTQTHIPL